MQVAVSKLDAKKAGNIDLDDAIFGIEEIRGDILQRMVRYQLSKRQAGTHKTKTRSEVARTTKKYIRQKGSGGARHGSRNAPIFVGGGVAHGPRVRSHAHDLPKKVRSLALKHALSSKVKAESLIVLEDASFAEGKTKALRASFEALGIENALIIGGKDLDEGFARAARNIPNVDVLPSAGLNVYDVLRRQTLVLTKDAVDAIHARFGEDGGAPAGAKPGDADFIDDVVLVDGIGAKSAKALAAEGYGELTKLAKIKADDAKALFEKIGVASRAEKEDWVGQAKAMVAGEAPRAKVDQRLLVKMRAQKAANGEG
jgi:large subunit ribosomal protein L4